MPMFYKIVRITAWLLVLAAVGALFSGLVMIKPALFPWFNYQLASWLHLIFGIFIFIPLFYLHSLAGLFLLLGRQQKLNKKSIKIIAGIIWTLIFISLMAIYFIPNPGPAKISNANQPNNAALTDITLSLAEISQHNSAGNCWLIIDNKVYDLTNYASHPGGRQTILKYCGQDGSVGFAAKDSGTAHSAYAAGLLNSYYLGDVGQTISDQLIQNIIGNQLPTPPGRMGDGPGDD